MYGAEYLKETKSVLWLFESNHLHGKFEEGGKRGVCLQGWCLQVEACFEHLARHKLADLTLDTFTIMPYNRECFPLEWSAIVTKSENFSPLGSALVCCQQWGLGRINNA
ncbi:MAG: hypothetical protein CM15mP117_06940 [Alphaproteobacteria bacterium]|nr:MAG: hypothetical protein CM15mP117_06940 [Alphaproteobacteria bacterium]